MYGVLCMGASFDPYDEKSEKSSHMLSINRTSLLVLELMP